MKARELTIRLVYGGTVGLIATVMYHGTQGLGAARAVTREHCWSWDLVPFNPEWLWPYLSLFALLALPWFTLRELGSVRRFAVVLLGMAAVGWITFLLFPTACARPDPSRVPEYLAFFYERVDGPNNCLPCLHSALTIFATYGICGRHARGSSPGCTILVSAWAVTILVSILALRQHTGADTLVGLVLGTAAAWLFSRWASSAQPATRGR
ncbi:phosphatase PAP2 family protein [Opitutus sp. ER46]|uniref:phosphatase PAP2 family protein n=1 Tax=Opitutus sp. ER46 TaxID=2161864 RepID=UPI000D31826D|nr:phosphatase PAP2 family protein [Opitutus sp. ER46]PTX90972.1 hypothetical protein DB354_20195 [Opitutus sp. ER46]